MSTATATPAAADPVAKPARKFPPPCWTQEETLALIDAYRERWYVLRRGYLRTADWDAVAAAVTSRCPDASPAKTSAQCRHKMEKLRQRYRAEKQRSLSYPTGRFFSSWFFFENMDAMENGTSVSTAGSSQEPENGENSGNGFPLKTFLDQNILKLKLNTKNSTKFDGNSSTSFGFSQGVSAKNSSKNADQIVTSDFSSKVFNGGYTSYLDRGSDKDDEDMDVQGGFLVNDGISGLTGFKGKNFGKIFGNSRSDFEFESLGGKGFDCSDGFDMQTMGDESLVPPRLGVKRIGKTDGKVNRSFDSDKGKDGFWIPRGTRGKYGGNLDSDLDSSRWLDGFYDPSRLGLEKRGFGFGGGGGGGGEAKRGRNPIDEMVSSIKMLGERFMKTENMKMDMAREIEKNRMEMEMKRNELILESQRQIVDAFAKGLIEMKNKKVKITTAPET